MTSILGIDHIGLVKSDRGRGAAVTLESGRDGRSEEVRFGLRPAAGRNESCENVKRVKEAAGRGNIKSSGLEQKKLDPGLG